MSSNLFTSFSKPTISSDPSEAVTMKDHRALEDLKVKYQVELDRVEIDLAGACQEAMDVVNTSDPDEILKIILHQEAERLRQWGEFATNVNSVKQELDDINAKFATSGNANTIRDTEAF